MKKRLVLIVLADVVPNLALGFLIGHVYPELVDDQTGAKEISKCSFTGGK